MIMYVPYDFSYSSRLMRFCCTCAGSLGGGGGGGGGAGAGFACINLPELSRSDQKYHGNCSMRLDWSKF